MNFYSRYMQMFHALWMHLPTYEFDNIQDALQEQHAQYIYMVSSIFSNFNFLFYYNFSSFLSSGKLTSFFSEVIFHNNTGSNYFNYLKLENLQKSPKTHFLKNLFVKKCR